MSHLLRGVLLCAVLAYSAGAGAQTPTPDELIEQGVAARRAGNDEGALALFRRAWERDHSYRSRAQMALAEQALGMWTEADTHLREALAARGDRWIEDHHDVLAQSLEEIDAHLGLLEVRCELVGADIRVNGASVGTTPLTEPLRLAAGTLSVEVVAPRYLPVTREVIITAGQTARETFELRPRSTSTVGLVATADEGRSGGILEAWWLWTLVGVVVVGAGVGIGVGVAAGSSTTTEAPFEPPPSGIVIMTLAGP